MSTAWRYAIHLGFPLNTFVSINWALTESDLDAMARLALFREVIGAWLHRHASHVRFAWIEVREKPRREGEGAHLALHIPRGLRKTFAVNAPAWLGQHSILLAPEALDVRPVYNWVGLRNYMLKAGDEDVRRKFGVERFGKGSQGVIEGPRLRVSHSIGPTVRRKAGFEA